MTALVAGEWNCRDWFRAARKRRVSLLVWDNSGGRFNGYGSVNGARVALRTLFSEWGSGAVPANAGGTDDVAGAGDADGASGSGWSGKTDGWYEPGGTSWLTDGAPAALNDYCPGRTSGAGTEIPNRYLYMAPAGSNVNAVDHQRALAIGSDHAFYGGPSTTIRSHYTYGVFDSAGSGRFRPSVYYSGNPVAAAAADINTENAPANALQDGSFDFTHSGAVSIYHHATHLNAGFTATMRGPVFLLYRQLTKPSITSGVAVTLGLSLGGRSNRAQAIAAGTTDPLAARTGMTLTMLKELLRQAVLGQLELGLRPMLLVRLNEGLNARNETAASVGPLAVSDGDSPEAYLDNNEAIKIRMRLAWTGLGYDLADLWFIETIDYPLDPDDAEMISFESPLMDAAASSEDSMAVAVRQLITGAQLTSGGYYDGGGQPHLTNAGYDFKETAIWRAAFAAARSGPRRTRSRSRSRASGRWARG